MRTTCRLAFAAGFGLLLPSAALAQGGVGSAGLGTIDPVPLGSSGATAGATAGTGPGLQGRRNAAEHQQRSAGLAHPTERDVRQLRDLNAMSRELAPGVPLPAPEAGMPRR